MRINSRSNGTQFSKVDSGREKISLTTNISKQSWTNRHTALKHKASLPQNIISDHLSLVWNPCQLNESNQCEQNEATGADFRHPCWTTCYNGEFLPLLTLLFIFSALQATFKASGSKGNNRGSMWLPSNHIHDPF